MLTWEQKCRTNRLYYVLAWVWDGENYNTKNLADALTLEEATETFKSTTSDPDTTYQIELWEEGEEDNKRLALKVDDWETWNPNEM